MERSLTPTTMADLMAAACEHFALAEEDLRGPCRRADLVRARWVFVWLAHLEGFSGGQLAAYLGKADHTAIVWARRRMRARVRARDGQTLADLAAVRGIARGVGRLAA